MSGEPSIQADILNNLARLAWWFGNQMLKATPFVLIAGFVLSAMGGVGDTPNPLKGMGFC